MKILMLSSSLSSGGVETHVTELAIALLARGHSVTVATAGGKLVKELQKHSVRHVKLSLDTHSPARLLGAVCRLSSLLRSESFDIIHTHSRIAALICKLALGKKKIPVVSTVHAHFKTGPVLRRLSFWGGHSIAVSEDLSEYLAREYGISKGKIDIIENGIDTERFAPNKKQKKDAPLHVLFASRLDTDCSLGALLLIKLAERLHKRSRDIVIEIAGGGKEQKRLSSLAKKVNFKLGYECVRLLGYCHDMPKAFESADIFVGVSRAALEAMSAGVPTVLCGNEGFIGVLDASTIKKAARTNFCCRGEELPDSQRLFDAITTLIDMSDSEREELGHYLRSYVITNHSLHSMAKRTEDFYKRALNESATHGHIVLCGYYGAGNLGDEAMLLSALARLNSPESNKKIYIISNKKQKPSTYDVKVIHKKNIPAIRRVIRGADRLILGGGSILQDKSSLRSLIYYTSLIKYAHKKGVRVELMSNGLGPFKRRISRQLAKNALCRADQISMRDKEALSLARSFGTPDYKLFLEDDLTSNTPPCDEERAKSILRSLCLSDKPFALISIRKGDTRKIKKQLKKHLYALEVLDITPLFVVMHKKEDLSISKKLAKAHNGKIFTPTTAEELCGIARYAHHSVGTRFHLLYLSKRAGIPIFPLGDDPKMKGL